jgi:hypothetical protein
MASNLAINHHYHPLHCHDGDVPNGDKNILPMEEHDEVITFFQGRMIFWRHFSLSAPPSLLP